MIERLKELVAVASDTRQPARSILTAEYELMKMMPQVIERLAYLEGVYKALNEAKTPHG